MDVEQAYVEIFDEKDLNNLIEQEPSNEDNKVPSPQIVNIE